MKNSNFKRKPSTVRILKEEKKKKKINWDKIIYLTILVFVVGSLSMFVFNRLYYVNGSGQVLFQKLDIRFVSDVQIVKINVHEGDSVSVGDSLFTYVDQNNASGHLIQSRRTELGANSQYAMEKERLETQQKIELKRIQTQEAQTMLDHYTEQLNQLKKQVYLDVVSVDKLTPYIKNINELKAQIASSQREIQTLQSSLYHLNKFAAGSDSTRLNDSIHNSNQPIEIVQYSPIHGTISQIFKEEYEVSLKTDIIMTLRKTSNPFIKAYFDQEYIKYLHEGTKVEIKFPDGKSSTGLIKRLYFDTYELPDELKNKTEPLQRSLTCDIMPADPIEAEKWKGFQKMDVEVKVKRNSF
ncbi:MAG: hypothetical protein IPP56_08175 [Bacteroidetes bacterium]|nr:hypothetical protein [Bacteroidota bacterium]MBK9672156.1 hypothetical protein [Bacteroidota bacterium]MBK9799697.1 hypothetical protein [Bacteroidota bacterium]MBP6412893.1 hypothetical protein [Bacteroidia bacterium]